MFESPRAEYAADLPLLDLLCIPGLAKSLKEFIDNAIAEGQHDKLRGLMTHRYGSLREDESESILQGTFYAINSDISVGNPGSVGRDANMQRFIDCFQSLLDLMRQVDWKLLDFFNPPNMDVLLESVDYQCRDGMEFHIKTNTYAIFEPTHVRQLNFSVKCLDLFLTELKKHKDKKDFIYLFNSNRGHCVDSYQILREKYANVELIQYTLAIRIFTAFLESFKDLNKAVESIQDIEITEAQVSQVLVKHIAPVEVLICCFNSDNKVHMIQLLLAEIQKPFSQAKDKQPNFDWILSVSGQAKREGEPLQQDDFKRPAPC